MPPLASRPAVQAARLGWQAAPAVSSGLVLLTMGAGLLPTASAYMTKLVLDELAHGRAADAGRATILAIAAALTAGLVAAAGYAAGLMSAVVQQRVRVHAARQLYGRINSMPGLRPFEDPVFHDRVVLAEQALEQAPGDVTSFLVTSLQRGIGILAYVGVLLTVWPPMAALLVATAVPTLLTHRWLARQHSAVLEAVAGERRRYDYYRRLTMDPRAAKEIRAYGLGALLQRRLTNALHAATGPEVAQQGRATGVEILFALVNAAVVAIGGVVAVRAAVRAQVSLGDVVFFLAALTAVQGAFTGVIAQFGMVASSLRLFSHYLAVVQGVADLRSGGVPVLALQHSLQFRDVWFRYQPAGPWVLRGLTMQVPAGQAVGIVGENGAGKSTLVKLLLRLYDPDRGQILWDGTPLTELDLDQLRRAVAVTFQDFTAYEMTAAENIAVGDLPGLHHRQRIEHVAREVEVDAAIRHLPDGYDTFLGRTLRGDGGGPGLALSGGQWQRLALARSLMRASASLALLDEPSASIDPTTEHHFHQVLRRFSRRRTSLLVTHRLNALRHTDNIIVLGSGIVVEQGTHEQLLALDGIYARMFRLQAQGYQQPAVVE